MYQLVFGMHANLTIDSADDPGVNPKVVRGDEQHAQRQLEAGERVLTWVSVTPWMRLYLPRVEARLRGITASKAMSQVR